jgi:beta-glucosidase
MTLECPDAGVDQDKLIDAVLAAQPNTIVLLETGNPVLTPWRDKARAIVQAWMPGDQGGTAIARVLYGDVDAGGRLPVTFPRSARQEQVAGDPAKYPGVLQTVTYKEGVLVGYRWFDARHETPAFPFGYGRSYTRFKYGKLAVAPLTGGALGAIVTIHVRNVGARRGFAVPQLYLGVPGAPGIVQPPRKLAGYAKLNVGRGRVKKATFTIDQRALSYWDVGSSGWAITKGCYHVMVGRSEADIVRDATVSVRGADCPGAVARIG